MDTAARTEARKRPHLLVAEDDEDTRQALAVLLGEHYQLALEASVHDALESFALARPDLLVVDYSLPDATGVRLIEAVREYWGDTTPAIMISACVDRGKFSEMSGFEAFVPKPFRSLDLVWAIERALASKCAPEAPRTSCR